MGVACSLCAQNAAQIWKKSLPLLWERADEGFSIPDLFAPLAPREEPTLKDLFCARGALVGFLQANGLAAACHLEGKAWYAEIRAYCASAAFAESEGVYFVLPSDYTFASPNPYAVDRILPNGERTREEQSLLTAQLLRVLAEECILRQASLALRVECDPEQALLLLAYLERFVGLPTLIWCLPPSADASGFLRFNGEMHKRSVCCGLLKQDFADQEMRRAFLRAYAKQYPLGRLRVL